MNVREQLELLGEVAEGQGGMVTSAQARGRGITRLQLQRATDSGNLERIAHGVYRITGVPTDPYESLRTAWLAIEPARTVEERLNDPQPRAVVCGAAAAWLHGLGDLDPVPYDIATTVRRRPRRDDVRTVTRQLANAEVTIRHGLPVTTVERTVADLILDDIDDEHIVTIATDALKLDFSMVETYIDQAPVRRRAKARATFRKVVAATADNLLRDLEVMSPELREQILLAAKPTFERIGAAINAQLAEAMKPARRRAYEALRPSVEQLTANLNALAAAKSDNQTGSRHSHKGPENQDQRDGHR
ncbi:MAG: type IV toxin-antitoxin system AbiEi family antitoxin domain-containing protein [Cumulibacter sp.]